MCKLNSVMQKKQAAMGGEKASMMEVMAAVADELLEEAEAEAEKDNPVKEKRHESNIFDVSKETTIA